MEYAVIIDPDLRNLIDLVNAKLREGWRPSGGIVAITGNPPDAKKDSHGRYWGPECYHFIQALVRATP